MAKVSGTSVLRTSHCRSAIPAFRRSRARCGFRRRWYSAVELGLAEGVRPLRPIGFRQNGQLLDCRTARQRRAVRSALDCVSRPIGFHRHRRSPDGGTAPLTAASAAATAPTSVRTKSSSPSRPVVAPRGRPARAHGSRRPAAGSAAPDRRRAASRSRFRALPAARSSPLVDLVARGNLEHRVGDRRRSRR